MLDGNLEKFKDFENILKILRIFHEFLMILKKISKNLQHFENQKKTLRHRYAARRGGATSTLGKAGTCGW